MSLALIPCVLQLAFCESTFNMPVNPYEPPLARAEALPSSDRVNDRSLRYAIDFEDIMEFQKFHFAHSPTMRNQRFGLIVFAACFSGAACVLLLSDLSFPLRLAIASVVAILSAMTVPLFFKRAIANQTQKLLREGSNEGILGEHELHIDERGLTEITSVNEARHALSSIARIEETDVYAFIYISTLQAHVIPKKKVQSGDIVGFMARLRELATNAQGRRLA